MDPLAFRFSLPRRHFTLELSDTRVPAGDTLALIGRSGAGKTSVLAVLAGLIRPPEGRIALGDEVWLDSATRRFVRPERRRVGLLPQDYGLLPHLTVERNVAFGARRRRPDLLEQLGVGHLARARPANLSGGERQRVALARALAREPRLLLLDEPFAALDTITRDEVRRDLRGLLAGLEMPTLLVTHSFADAALLAGRVAVVEHGRVLQCDAPDALLQAPANATVARLLGLTVLSGSGAVSEGRHTVVLAGGGSLVVARAPAGPVEVAVAPWDLRLAASGAPGIVTAVQRESAGWLVHTDRLTLRLPAGEPPPAVGALVHATAAPEALHVYPAAAPVGAAPASEGQAVRGVGPAMRSPSSPRPRSM